MKEKNFIHVQTLPQPTSSWYLWYNTWFFQNKVSNCLMLENEELTKIINQFLNGD